MDTDSGMIVKIEFKKGTKREFLYIEKVSYASELLTMIYEPVNGYRFKRQFKIDDILSFDIIE